MWVDWGRHVCDVSSYEGGPQHHYTFFGSRGLISTTKTNQKITPPCMNPILSSVYQVMLPPEEAVVLITTYSMLAYTGKRNDEVDELVQWVDR